MKGMSYNQETSRFLPQPEMNVMRIVKYISPSGIENVDDLNQPILVF